ncbi:hypothetical protein C7M84_002369 [Penaeus vannamei]|uniref:Uncharacterized protein n=1 Tax=Penaeus vannamei TaxID=6689 RepID=A0A423TR20_PENVA|nr:hypothetical protein C7M84_002369 [Penaeus vannamei]
MIGFEPLNCLWSAVVLAECGSCALGGKGPRPLLLLAPPPPPWDPVTFFSLILVFLSSSGTMKVILLVATALAVAAARSIDNPAESPAQSPSVVKAVPTVEDKARSLAVPPPVQSEGGFRPSAIGGPNPAGLSPGGPQVPDFYQKYLKNERAGVIAESSFEDDNISTSSEQVVSYSYLAAPQDSALSTTSHRSSNDVVYGSGSAAKPPGQLSASVVSVAPSKTASKPVAAAQTASKPVEAARTSHVSVAPATILTASSQNSVVAAPSSVHASISNAVPFGHSEASTFAVHHDTGAHHQVSHSAPQAFHGNAPAPPHAPASVLPANPSNFIIKDATFQAHPGAPTFNVPIPIPNHQLAQAGSDSSYTTYYADELAAHQEAATKKPVFQKMMEPFRKAGAQIYEMASPVFKPMINAGQMLSHRFRIPERMSDVSDSLALGGVNDYIERTVGAESLPVIAGAAALGLLGLGLVAIAANSNVTIGKRSVDDPTEEFMYQLLDELPLGESGLLERLEGYTSWTDSKCSKRIFCDVMGFLSDDYLYSVEKRLGLFLSLLDRGSAEESSLKRTADDVMLAVRRRQCSQFTCGGDGVDSSQVVSRGASGPR